MSWVDLLPKNSWDSQNHFTSCSNPTKQLDNPKIPLFLGKEPTQDVMIITYLTSS